MQKSTSIFVSTVADTCASPAADIPNIVYEHFMEQHFNRRSSCRRVYKCIFEWFSSCGCTTFYVRHCPFCAVTEKDGVCDVCVW